MTDSMYYFPALFLLPDFEIETFQKQDFNFIQRRWGTSIFDLATLATKHKLHLPYQLMDFFLQTCNLEIACKSSSCDNAKEKILALRCVLYSSGISPFILPFCTTYSINQYSCICERDSPHLRERLDSRIREGLTTETGILEAWPFELSFQTIQISHRLKLSKEIIEKSIDDLPVWHAIKSKNPALQTIEDTINFAPRLISLEQSCLHIWSAIEALFPSVSTEVAFKLALFTSQLTSNPQEHKEKMRKVKANYRVRCGVTHGSRRTIDFNEWLESWDILLDCFRSIIRRGYLPSEEDLMEEIFS